MAVFELTDEVIIGIDLAGKPENSTGWATWRNKIITTSLFYTDEEILDGIIQNKPKIIAIDAPFMFPKKGMLRKADREMISRGYRVFSPCLPAMKTLTHRAISLNKQVAERGFKTIEVHPTSTCKALGMPIKEWKKIQTVLKQIGLEGEVEMCMLTPHEIDAILSALTAHLYLKNKTLALGDKREGYIVVPKRQQWRTLKI